MQQYRALVQEIVGRGKVRSDRTGVGTVGIFGHQMRFNLAEGFPLVTLKRTFFKGVVAELLWFLRGDTNIKWLNEQGVHIWDEWADENGNLGPVYGAMWREWPAVTENTDPESSQTWDVSHIDQIYELVDGLRRNPFSRRHIVSGWNPALLPDERSSHAVNVMCGRQALPPCHTMFQMHVEEVHGVKHLSCQLYQRSADVFLGVPFNIASYALLTHLIAHHLGYEVGEFIWTGGDCHLYLNHLGQVQEMLAREPRALPSLAISHPAGTPLDQVEISNISINNYNPHPAISAPVAV